MYPHLLPDTGEHQKTLTETKNAANEHITRFARLLRSFLRILSNTVVVGRLGLEPRAT